MILRMEDHHSHLFQTWNAKFRFRIFLRLLAPYSLHRCFGDPHWPDIPETLGVIKDMVREGFRCKPCCSGWMSLKILWRICTSSSMTLVVGLKKIPKENVAQGPDVWCLKLVVESSRPVQVTLSSQVAQPSWKVSHAKNPWKTLMKYVFFLYKRGAGMVRVFLYIYISPYWNLECRFGNRGCRRKPRGSSDFTASDDFSWKFTLKII